MQSGFDLLDDGTELDADRSVALSDDQGLRIVAHRGEKLGVAQSQRPFPGLGEDVRGDEFRYPVANHGLDALRGRSFQGVKRGAGCRAGAEGLDPVQDLGGELFDVDVLVDRRRCLIDDEVLDLGVAGKGCIGRDKGVGVGEGGLRPSADHGHRRHQASEHDEHGGQYRPTPPSRTTSR